MEYVFLEPWLAADNSPTVIAELQKEINQQHPLSGKSVELIGRSLQADDYLFKVANSIYKYCVVHLTWTGRKETSSSLPTVAFYKSWEAFTEEVMKPLLKK
ncbi:hypothetical protein [Spirosoma pomorum]